jgi:hypothetical protein
VDETGIVQVIVVPRISLGAHGAARKADFGHVIFGVHLVV